MRPQGPNLYPAADGRDPARTVHHEGGRHARHPRYHHASMVGKTSIGIGAALQRARQIRGLSIEGAARDSRMPAKQLRALEDEDFTAFDGEVFARAALGSYTRFLGLDPDKVLGVYARHADDPEPPPPPAKLRRVERALAVSRVRDNQRFLLVAAAAVVVVLIVFGLVSRQGAVPQAADLPTSAGPVPASTGSVEVVLFALRPVRVSVSIDGGEIQRFEMGQDETRALVGSISIDLGIDDGAAVRLSVDGRRRGVPGEIGIPWRHVFEAREEGAAGSPTG